LIIKIETMKNTFLLFTFLILSASFFAQAPQKMSYQAVIRNSNGALVNSTTVGIKISIIQGSIAGTIVYSETQSTTTNANGLASLEIGSGVVISGSFSSINWAAGPLFIKTQTDPTGGTNYTITGSSQLMSVPYALFSANGTPGPAGPQGLPGTNGTNGAQGPIGLTGAQGQTGPAGPQGLQGLPGTNGTNGAQGPIGLTGAQGQTGPAGATGAQGIQGETGPAGADGAVGPAGAQGIQGETGPAGADGAVGETGATGPQGPAGNDGETGPVGPQGLVGPSAPPAAMNYAQNIGTQVILTAGDFQDIISITLTTSGGPVEVSTYGDANNPSGPVLGRLQLYRDTIALGNDCWVEGDATNENQQFGMSVVDEPPAGTHTYTLKANYLQSTTYFGETSGPVIHAIELLGPQGAASTVAGPQGLPGATGPQGEQGIQGLTGATGPQGIAGTNGTNGQVGGFTHYLGEAFNGGIIFYLYKGSDGLEHGLIVALTESTAKWQTTATLVNANRTEDGAYNTTLMTNSPAATYIAGLGAGWYLPSIDELGLLYYNRYSAQKGLRTSGNTLLSNTAVYWSSFEFNATSAYDFSFNGGTAFDNTKTGTKPVRGVRAF
jgi:hypothetical protein